MGSQLSKTLGEGFSEDVRSSIVLLLSAQGIAPWQRCIDVRIIRLEPTLCAATIKGSPECIPIDTYGRIVLEEAETLWRMAKAAARMNGNGATRRCLEPLMRTPQRRVLKATAR